MAIYHLTVSYGSRAGGQSAGAKARYIQREGQYRGRDDLLYRESKNLPAWAEQNPTRYWDAADTFERANGRLFVQAEFALPIELNRDRQIELAREFAHQLTQDERLPYTLAIHHGGGRNPHAHLMLSERTNDGRERPPAQWFRRYNAREPESGGSRKTVVLQKKDWLLRTREGWAREANKALERERIQERIDHRSFKDRGIEREPGYHLGPFATKLEKERGMRSRKREEIERERAPEILQRQALGKELAATEKELVRWQGYVTGFEREKAAELSNALDRLSPRDAIGRHPELERAYPLLAAYAQHARESGLDRTAQAKLLEQVKEQATQKLAAGERLLEPEELPFVRAKKELSREQERDREGLDRTS